MTVELRPLGVFCNIACDYCYQQPQRDAGNVAKAYDIELMKAAIEAEGGPFALFGGEPLLLPLKDLEALWAWGLERFGENSVQTNGTVIRPAHIELFKRYKVHVGLSMDGPGELNAARRAGRPEKTLAATAKSEQAIRDLLAAGVTPSLIVTLHGLNARGEALERMNAWFRELDALGVRKVRLHVLESETEAIRQALGLTQQESIDAFLNFRRLERTLPRLRFDVFAEMRHMLMGEDDQASCVWTGCDPYTTRAVRGVEGMGQRSNCGRTNKDGVDFVKSAAPGYERYLALYHVDQADGGCQGCRFFLMCKGYCPGTALEGDWRNRTEHCGLWMALFAELEAELVAEGGTPLSLRADRAALEREMMAAWASGNNPKLNSLHGSR